MENKINIAYSQLSEILKYIPTEYFEKLPDEILEKIKLQSSSNYIFEYNPQETFAEQNILEETRTMISILYRDYWANGEERNRIKIKEQNERIRNEKIAKEKYNIDNIFKKERSIENKSINTEKNLPVKSKKITIFQKILNFIRKI